MKNFTLLSLTLLNYFSRGPYFNSPSSFSPNRLAFDHAHASRFLSSYLRSHRLLSLQISHSKFDTFISSGPIIQTSNYLNHVCNHFQSPVLTGDCERLRLQDGQEVSVTDTYFMNLNFTSDKISIKDFPPLFSGDPDYTLVGWHAFTGGCLHIVSDYLLVSNCYFYQINTEFLGGALFSVTKRAPTFSQLIIRSHCCNISEALPLDFLELLAPHSPHFYGNMIRSYVSDSAPLEPFFFNYSSLLDARFQTSFGGSAFGGIVLSTTSRVVVNGINCTRVNSELSNGLGFIPLQENAFPLIQYSEFYNCSNYAFGILSFISMGRAGPRIEYCNFIEQTSDAGLISIIGTAPEVGTPTLVVRNSICLTTGNLFVFYGGTVRVELEDVVFSNPADNLVYFTPPLVPENFTLIVQPNVALNAGLDYERREDIGEELAKIPNWKLTVTLAFTPSVTFSLWQPHNTPSVFANSTSGVSAGVLATIFGILSLIVFLFLLYVRRGSAVTYILIGRFSPNLEFDGVAPAVAYDGDAAEYEYTYSVSYEYSYGSENGEVEPAKSASDS